MSDNVLKDNNIVSTPPTVDQFMLRNNELCKKISPKQSFGPAEN